MAWEGRHRGVELELCPCQCTLFCPYEGAFFWLVVSLSTVPRNVVSMLNRLKQNESFEGREPVESCGRHVRSKNMTSDQARPRTLKCESTYKISTKLYKRRRIK